MVTTWPRRVTVAPRGRYFMLASMIFCTSRGHRAQVAVLGGGVKVDGGQDVVMRHHGGASGAAEAAQAAQHLRRRRWPVGHRQVLQRLQRVQFVFRRLGASCYRRRRSWDSSQKLGAVCAGAGQGRRQRVGDVLLGQAQLRDAAAVGVEISCGWLLDCCMRASARPGMLRIWRRMRKAKALRRVAVGAGDLHVDRRGRAEIQDLADDVGGREGKGDCREKRAAAFRACVRT